MSAAPLHLDFRRRPLDAWRWFGWLLLGMAVVALVLLAERHGQLTQDHAAARERLERLSGALRAREPQRRVATVDPKLLAAVRSANAVIDQLTVPWDGLFEAVEAADMRGVGLLALTPTARDRSLRVAGEARAMPELLAYVDRLAAQPSLGQVHLLGFNTAQRDGVPVLSFSLSATWRAPP